MRLESVKKKIMDFVEISRKKMMVCSEMILYLMMGTSEKAKNLVSMVTFHALSNDVSQFKIKKFQMSGVLSVGRFSHGLSLNIKSFQCFFSELINGFVIMR